MPGFDVQYLMRQAKKMEQAMEQAREKLGELSVEAESGGGLVKVKMDGRHMVQRIELDPKALDPNEKQLLEDLIAAAVNAASEKASAAANESMNKATGGLKMPLPF